MDKSEILKVLQALNATGSYFVGDTMCHPDSSHWVKCTEAYELVEVVDLVHKTIEEGT